MLVLSDQSLDSLDREAIEAWLQSIVPQVLERHPNWAEELGKSGVESVCREIEAFSRRFNLTDEGLFWTILEAKLRKPDLLSTLTQFQIFALDREAFSDRMRFERFMADHIKGSPTRLLFLNQSREEEQ